ALGNHEAESLGPHIRKKVPVNERLRNNSFWMIIFATKAIHLTTRIKFLGEGLSNSLDDEKDTRSSHEYLNDLEDKYQARAFLAKSKRFFKKGTQRFSSAKATDQTECHKCGKKGHFARDYWSKTSVPSYQSPFQSKSLSFPQHKPELRPTKEFEAKYNKVKAKLALLSSSTLASKSSTVKNKGLITEAYEWDEEEMSSNDNEMVEVKVLMALAEDNDVVGKEGAKNRNGILPAESQRNTTDPSVAVTDSLATDYDSADESLVCSIPLPSLKKLDSDEPISRPKTIKSILRSRSTFKAKTLKSVIINEPSLALAKDNKSSSASKVKSAPFNEKRGTIFNSNKEAVMIAPRVRDVYILNMTTSADESCFFAKASENLNWLWHKRLAHLNFKRINKLVKQNLVIGLSSLFYSKDKLCSSCENGKHHRASFKTKHTSSIKKCLHLLHIDLFGPITPRFINHEKYTLVIVDEYSRYTYVYFLKKKSQAPKAIMSFIKRVKNQNDIKVKLLRTENEDTLVQDTISILNPPLPIPLVVIPSPQDRWSQDKHIELVYIIGNPGAGMLTRVMAKQLSAASAHECLFVDFLSKEESKKISEALKHPGWVDAMQDKLN
nr:retrovirus-related Pol polyprotein from transposon TNT 1-94 [Tanacetum cinerariifolium]